MARRRVSRGRRPAAPRIPKSASTGHLLVRPDRPDLGMEFWRTATCAEVECVGYRAGFRIRVDEGSPLGQAQAAYLRSDRSRRGVESRDELGLTVFTFAPGQRCTNEYDDAHRVPIERDPLLLIRRGVGRRQVSVPEWTDSLQEATGRLAELRS